jgi:hypothetical protein
MEAHFPLSGAWGHLWLSPAIAFLVSFATSMAGISGAFLLLPFQMSVLGFVGPAVSPTNLIYNLVAVPSGALRYAREKRVVWPLALVMIAGTLPGVVAGGWIRLAYLPDPARFKIFAGSVLLLLGARLLFDMVRPKAESAKEETSGRPRTIEEFAVDSVEFSWRRLAYGFRGRTYGCPTLGLFALSLVVGGIGGIYGIGGGAIIAPFLVGVLGLPVHTVAGATLVATFATSAVGVAFYELAAGHYENLGMAVRPDWALGLLLGAGGMAGMYAGARTQRFVPGVWLKLALIVVLVFVAAQYLAGLRM